MRLYRTPPIRKHFYKISRESALQIPRLPLRYKTEPLEEEQKNPFSGDFLLWSFNPPVWIEAVINYSELFIKYEVKFAARPLRSKLPCKITSLPQGSLTCPPRASAVCAQRGALYKILSYAAVPISPAAWAGSIRPVSGKRLKMPLNLFRPHPLPCKPANERLPF